MAKKVLIVDDDQIIRRTLEIHLRRSGYEVITADNCARGLELAVSGDLSIILCDLKLPDRSGMEIIRTVKELEINVPVVAVSGFIDEKVIQEAKSAGAVEYLAKPFLKDALLSTVRDVIAAHREL